MENRQAERVSISEEEQHDRTNAVSAEHYAADSLGADSQKLETSETAVSVMDEVVVTTTKEYDTSKPIDERTGRPPLSKEITETRQRQQGQQTESRLSQTNELSSRTSQQSERRDTVNIETTANCSLAEQSAESVDTQESIDKTERRGLNGAQNALCWFGGIVLLLLVGYLIYKIVKRKLKII